MSLPLARLLLRSVCWTTLLAAGIMALILWRTLPESQMTFRVGATMFGIVWGLSFVPIVIAELLVAHLRIELGEVKERERRR